MLENYKLRCIKIEIINGRRSALWRLFFNVEDRAHVGICLWFPQPQLIVPFGHFVLARCPVYKPFGFKNMPADLFF